MEIFKIIIIAICTIVSAVILKQIKPEFSTVIVLSGGVLILLIILALLKDVLVGFNEFVSKTGLSSDVFKTLIKVCGIGYLVQFTTNLCLDSGFSGVADYVVLAGRVVILILCFPIFKNLFSLVAGLL